MNSLQLITRIKSKLDDLQMLHADFFGSNKSLSLLEKELLKKNCAELYEMVLKLKTIEQASLFQEPITETPAFHKLPKLPDLFAAEPEPKVIEKQVERTEMPTESLPIEKSAEPIVEANTSSIMETELPVKEESILQESVLKDAPFVQVIQHTEPELTLNDLGNSFETEPDDLPPMPEIPVLPIPEKPSVQKPELKIGRTVMPEIPKPADEPKVLSIEKVILPDTDTDRLNDRIAQLKDKPAQEKFIEPKIDNLKTAITLNRKIAFVNELFKENVVEYAKAVDRLNTAIDMDEALRHFSELKHHYNWDSQNELVRELERLIERRHK